MPTMEPKPLMLILMVFLQSRVWILIIFTDRAGQVLQSVVSVRRPLFPL